MAYTAWIITIDQGGDQEFDAYSCDTRQQALDIIKQRSQNYLGKSSIEHPNGNMERVK